MLFASLEGVHFLPQSKSINFYFCCILGPRMPKSLGGHSAVQFGGDLYTIGGLPNAYQKEIQRISCSSRVCTWTTINQQLKVGRSWTVAIPVMDSLCIPTTSTTDKKHKSGQHL